MDQKTVNEQLADKLLASIERDRRDVRRAIKYKRYKQQHKQLQQAHRRLVLEHKELKAKYLNSLDRATELEMEIAELVQQRAHFPSED